MKSFAYKFTTNSSSLVYTIEFDCSTEAQKFLVECFWDLYEILNRYVPDNIGISFYVSTCIDITNIEEGVGFDKLNFEKEIKKLLEEKGFNGQLSLHYEG